MKLGNSATLTRRYNKSVVLDALRRNGSLSRVELARHSGLTPQAIRNIVEELRVGGLIRETGRRKGFRGQPQIDIEINPDGGYSLGLQVDAGHFRHVATNLAGEIIYEGREQPMPRDYEGTVAMLDRVTSEVTKALPVLPRLGVGAVFSRPFISPWMINNQTVEEFEAQSLAIEEFFHNEVSFENDANAAGMAESMFGLTRNNNGFLYLFVGDGVGGGIIHAGEPLRGVRGNAAEFGHILVRPEGSLCHCGNRGCLHGFLSIADLRERWHLMESFQPSDVPDEWFDEATFALGRAIITLENILDPERFIIGGTAPRWLLERLTMRLGDLEPSVRSSFVERRIEVSELGERCALLGASALPLLGMTNPTFGKLTKQSMMT